MQQQSISIALVQEPYVYNNIVPSHASFRVFTSDSSLGRPRAAIIVSPQLNALLHNHLSSPDLVVCSVQLAGRTCSLLSAYIPPHTNADGVVVPLGPYLARIDSALRVLPGKVLLGGDFNSHHYLWGSDGSDRRGEDVCDFAAASNLHLLNNSSEPTFYTTRDGVQFQSSVDLTFASTSLLPWVSNWQVHDGLTSSDHRPISIELNFASQSCTSSSTRRFITQGVDWSLFNTQITSAAVRWRDLIGGAIEKEAVDRAAAGIIADIVSISQRTLPPVRRRKQNVPWWTNELTQLRRVARRWKKRCIRVRSSALVEIYLPVWREHQRRYDEAILKAKQDSWRQFVSSQERETVWSQVYRLCRDRTARPPSTVRKADGTSTVDAQDTAQYLLDSFLPSDCLDTDTRQHKSVRVRARCPCAGELTQDDCPFSAAEIAQVVASQNDRKSPGHDGLSANIIKAVYSQAKDVIDALFCACLATGCFPRCFKHSIVRAVPKPSATDTASAKSWRPISLLPVLGKVFEKLMIQRIMHHLRSRNLLSPNQFGFTPQRSTTDAITKVVNRMQSVLAANQVGAVVSLDVSGAFDHAWWPAILDRLLKLGTPHNLWHLLNDYFDGRTAEFEIAGGKATKPVTMGCPQGSACGPGLWIILYDEVLQMHLPDDCELIAFADDLILMCWSTRVEQLELSVNTAIAMIADWGRSVKLSFNEAKTQAVVFSKKRQPPQPNFVMNGTRLQTVPSFRYLGVILDNKLKWRLHLQQTQRKAMKITSRIAAVARNTWGLSSELTEALYKGVIEPVVLYGVEAWRPALNYKWATQLLTKIQRSALLRVCKSYRTVSADALPIIANILPLPTRATMLHRLSVTKSSGYLEVGGGRLVIQKRLLPNRHPAICIRDVVRLHRDASPPVITSPMTIFTDGSKSETGGVGAAFVVYTYGEECHHEQFRLPDNCSVFQAELVALKKALHFLLNARPPLLVTIYSDSFSSLQAINDRHSTTPLVVAIQDLILQLLQSETQLTITWVKAHVGIIGNERADELAKDCLCEDASQVDIPAPLSFAKRQFLSIATSEWNTAWTNSEKGRWTAEIFPTVEHRKKVGKIQLSFVLTQFLSGHGKFGSYLQRMHCRDDSICECGSTDQDCRHLLFDCPLLDDIRTDLEDACYRKNISFSIDSLKRILSDAQLRESFTLALNSIHHRLVLWESRRP